MVRAASHEEVQGTLQEKEARQRQRREVEIERVCRLSHACLSQQELGWPKDRQTCLPATEAGGFSSLPPNHPVHATRQGARRVRGKRLLWEAGHVNGEPQPQTHCKVRVRMCVSSPPATCQGGGYKGIHTRKHREGKGEGGVRGWWGRGGGGGEGVHPVHAKRRGEMERDGRSPWVGKGRREERGRDKLR